MHKVTVTQEVIKQKILDALTPERVEELAESVSALVFKSNQKYGDAWQDHGILTPLLRIKEKIMRTKQLDDNQWLIEKGDAEFNDIIGYAALAELWIGSGQHVDWNQLSFWDDGE